MPCTCRHSAPSGDHREPAHKRRLMDRDIGHKAALRQLGNRLVGILHGCIKSHTLYDEAVAWNELAQQVAA
jgi:hypothetical protein